jgi:leucyl aminopeptidase
MDLARELVDRSLEQRDPMWHLPLWRDYHGGIESDIADTVNTGKSALGGAITAALFLEDFVPAGQDWLHIDLYAWNNEPRPGRPVGGEAQTIRTLLSYLEARYAVL